MHTEANRTIINADAIQWLQEHPQFQDCSMVTSLPDYSEFPNLSLDEWKAWFTSTAELILSKCPDDGVSIFFQSDIKHQYSWVDKGYLCLRAAEKKNINLLWHKIVCRAPAGVTTFGRPSYSHLLCFSKNIKLELDHSTPDVITDAGKKTWARGIGLQTCIQIISFITKQTKSKTIINPFCGEGGILAVANQMRLNAIGIEKNYKRSEIAKTISVDLENCSWKKNAREQSRAF